MADNTDDVGLTEDAADESLVLMQTYQPPDERYITQPLPPCYSGVSRMSQPSPRQQDYVTQRQPPPLYQTSMVKVDQTASALRRPTWELQPDMVWGQPNPPQLSPAGAAGSPSTISIHVDSKGRAVVVDEAAEQQKRIEEADELAAKDVVCCCLGCVFGWIVC